MTAHRTVLVVLVLLGSGCTVFVDRELDRAAQRNGVQDEDDGGHSGDRDAGLDGAQGDGDASSSQNPEDSGTDAELSTDGSLPDAGDGESPALKLCIGVRHACALKPDGDLICWGEDAQEQRDGLTGRYKEVACGDYHTCAIDLEGTLWCIGRNMDGQAPQRVAGGFSKVAAGNSHTCAINGQGYVNCWGAGSGGTGSMQATPIAAQFKEIAAGEDFTCGIRKDDDHVSCWGSASLGRKMPPADASFTRIDLGRAHGCGVTTSGSVLCWGDTKYAVPAPIPSARQIAAGQYLTCALLENRTLQCWSDGSEPLPSDWTGRYTQVAAGDAVLCAVPEGGELRCLTAGSHPIVNALPSKL